MINQEHYNEPCHRTDGWIAVDDGQTFVPPIRAAKLNPAVAAIRASEGQPQVPADQVYQPQHYARYIIEPATFIAANKLPFDVGNVVKYVCRYDAKNGREDLKKAARYIEMLIERLDREDRVAAGENPQVVWSKIL